MITESQLTLIIKAVNGNTKKEHYFIPNDLLMFLTAHLGAWRKEPGRSRPDLMFSKFIAFEITTPFAVGLFSNIEKGETIKLNNWTFAKG